ncbi:MAG: restriction endonuclease subunit S [Phycisphaerae bacterium]
MNNYPRNWTPHKLDRLGVVGRGKSRNRPRNDPSLYGGQFPFVQTGDIKNADLYLSEYSQTYNEKGLSQSKLWNPGTLCITIAANIAETTILKIKACFPDSVVGFIADPEKSDVRFIKYYIDTIKLRMQNVSKGTTQDNLSLEKLLTFDFVVPDVENQNKIASILSSYDDLIENNTRRIKILEQMAETIYTEWFVKFRFPGHEKVKFVNSELGKIPEGWTIGKVGDLYAVKSGFAFKSNNFLPIGEFSVIKITNIQNNVIDTVNCEYISEKIAQSASRFEIYEGDLFISMTGAQVGKVGIMPKVSQKYFLNQRVGKYFPKKPFLTNVSFIYLFSLSDYFQKQISNIAAGAAQPNISGGSIESIPLLLPPNELIEIFTSFCDYFLRNICILHYKNRV